MLDSHLRHHTYNCPVALGFFVVLVDNQLHPRRLASATNLRQKKGQAHEVESHSRIDVVSAMRCAGFHHRC